MYLLATKLEAFRGRGNGDFLASRDFGDIIALLDGRAEITTEFAAAEAELRQYVAAELSRIRDEPLFESGVAGAFLPDEASQARLELIVRPRMDELIAAAP